MKAHRTLTLTLTTLLAVAGVSYLGFHFVPLHEDKKPQPVEADPESNEPEDEGFRDCPDDAEEQISNEPVQHPPMGEFCIPDLIPFDQPMGPLNAHMSLESLQTACGDVFADFIFYLGEGQCQWGTAMYHGTDREVQIAWRNWKDKRSPSFVHFVGKALHFESGFGPGMKLKDVEKINGRPLSMAGFGWDASGFHRSFQGGNLRAFDEAGDTHYLIRYTLDWDAFDAASDEETASIITGEGLIDSTVPALEKYQARVDYIEYIFAAEARASTDGREQCRGMDAFTSKIHQNFTAKLVQDIFDTMMKEIGCDDGIYAEIATDVVSRSLVEDFDSTLQYAESDTRVGIFLLSHLNETASHTDLEKIANMQSKCSKREKGLCNNIIAQAKKSLSN